ncbi:MAG: hypothetical protein Q9201_005556 [Fulgogasparrea decipioides]
MSKDHQYHQPNAPDSPGDESDSDIELDINELGPHSGKGRNELDGSPTWDQQNPESRIPLRNLRLSRIRGFRDPSHDDSYRDGDAEGLLQDPLGGRDPEGTLDDSAPLLESGDGSAARHKLPDQASQGPSSSLRLARFPTATTNGISSGAHEQHENNTAGTSRNIAIGQYPPPRFPPNAVSNAKFTAWSFLPRTLYNEFSFFFNMYFLLVALSQLIPPLRIGYVSTYVVPLIFVLSITLGKEALDDLARRRRDAEANNEAYTVLRLHDLANSSGRKRQNGRTLKGPSKRSRRNTASSLPSRLDVIEEEEERLGHGAKDSVFGVELDELRIRSRDIKVGDVVKLGKDQRVPADLVILKCCTVESGMAASPPQPSDVDTLDNSCPEPDIGTHTSQLDQNLNAGESNSVGEAFLRTDQLDGETDWKLRLASPLTQALDPREFARLRIVAGRPSKKVNEFVGTVEYLPQEAGQDDGTSQKALSAPLTIDNTAWANTVLASNATVLAVVVYTGAQTRQAMSTTPPRSKTGLLDSEINNLTKILCALTLSLSIILVALEGFENAEEIKWYVAITRFLILFSTIIPISLRVNLDMGKSVYAWFIERDQGIPGTVVRTSTIPEELGRIEYLLSDKTGTLTQNEMELKKIHVGTVSYANEAMDEVASYVRQAFVIGPGTDALQRSSLVTPSSNFHNSSVGASAARTRREIGSRVRDLVLALALCHNVTPTTEEEDGHSFTTYQASSPDEIAIVRWTEQIGLRLVHRDRKSITLQSVETSRVVVRARVLDVFPFTSEGKRMGIVLQFLQGEESDDSNAEEAGEIWFYQKGADTVMTSIVAANDWLDEETANMAREGFRTLVVGRRKLSAQQYQEFSASFKEASLSLQSRDVRMARVVKGYLESNLELLGVTGVEDKLQKDVKPSLELLRNAGIKIWMLTGDKVETARCVAVSAKLVSRTQFIHTITKLTPDTPPSSALDLLSLLRSKPDSTALLIDGDSLSYFLSHHRWEFISIAVQLPAAIACRCSPTQKADIAYLIRQFTKKRVACIGDGGNDVSMIQAADVGVGIVGKEGRQASLAADFSITSFHHLTKLLVWHGRNSYKRSAKLAQFIIHRGLIISVCQTIYSIATHFEPNALYKDWLLVGYATVYTMAPVFSLVLDKDVDEGLANLYPELYKELTNGQSLSYRTFFVWVAVSIYQGSIIQGLSQILVGSVDSPQMVSVSFTVLVINELIMVACEIVTWHRIMVASLLGTMAIYIGSVPFLGGYFDLGYVWSWGFAWRVAAISAISLIPPYSVKILRRTLKPPSYRKGQIFMHFTGTFYYANLSLGTPPQKLRLSIDTGSSDLWSNAASSPFCQRKGRCSESGTYNANASSTYRYIDSRFNITYGHGGYGRGDHASDTIHFGGRVLTGMEFGIGYNSDSGGGVIGLGYAINEAHPRDPKFKPYSNMPQLMVDQELIHSNAYSLWLDDRASSTGSLLFGGVDTAKYHGTLQTFPVQQIYGHYAEFLISLTGLGLSESGFSAHSFHHALPANVLLDSGATLTYLPDILAHDLFSALDIKYDRSKEAATVDCMLASSNISVDFSFTTKTISVPMRELVLPLQSNHKKSLTSSGKKCDFAIVPARSSDAPILGDTFLRSAYVVFDLANNEISLAQTNFDPKGSHIVEIGAGNRSVPPS